MKEIIEDLKKEAFSKREWLVYGVVYPTSIMVICITALWINSL